MSGGGEVNNGKTTVAEADVPVSPMPGVIRAAVRKQVGHLSQHCRLHRLA
jgi:hypothetical protein